VLTAAAIVAALSVQYWGQSAHSWCAGETGKEYEVSIRPTWFSRGRRRPGRLRGVYGGRCGGGVGQRIGAESKPRGEHADLGLDVRPLGS
jgi:hypothetical protein